MCLSRRLGTLNWRGHEGQVRVGAYEGGGDTPSSSSLPLKGTAGRERVPGGRVVRDTPAGRARPPAYRHMVS